MATSQVFVGKRKQEHFQGTNPCAPRFPPHKYNWEVRFEETRGLSESLRRKPRAGQGRPRSSARECVVFHVQGSTVFPWRKGSGVRMQPHCPVQMVVTRGVGQSRPAVHPSPFLPRGQAETTAPTTHACAVQERESGEAGLLQCRGRWAHPRAPKLNVGGQRPARRRRCACCTSVPNDQQTKAYRMHQVLYSNQRP